MCAERVAQAETPNQMPTTAQLRLVLNSLHASRAVLVEDGYSSRRISEGQRRVVLNLEPGEVHQFLKECGQTWREVLES